MNSIKLTIAGAVCLLLVLIVASQTVSSKNPSGEETASAAGQVLKIGTDGTEPAYYQVDGVQKGFDYEMAEEVGKSMGVKIQWVKMDFDALFPAVANHKIDMVAAEVTDTPEREAKYSFSEPYFVTYVSFLTPAGSPIHKKSDVNGKRIAVLDGTVEERYLKEKYKNVQIVIRKDEDAAVQAIKEGKADAFFYDATYADPIIKAAATGPKPLTLEMRIRYPADDAPIAFVLAKGDTRKVQIDKALDGMLVDGTWLRIKNEYFHDYPLSKAFASKGVA